MTVKAIDTDLLTDKDIRSILKDESESLIAHLFAVSPVDMDEMRHGWAWLISGLKSAISNPTEYLPYVRKYYIERQGYDLVDDTADEWAAGKPRRAPLRPLKYEFDFTDFVFRPKYVQFRMVSAVEGVKIPRQDWDRQSSDLLRYMRQIQPVDTAKMQGSWKRILEGNSVLFVNTTEYTVYARAYYQGIRFKNRLSRYSGSPYDFIKDAIEDWKSQKPIRPRLIPRGRRI